MVTFIASRGGCSAVLLEMAYEAAAALSASVVASGTTRRDALLGAVRSEAAAGSRSSVSFCSVTIAHHCIAYAW